MSEKKIGVGIIGASPVRSWAMNAHIPALRSLPQFELTAVSTSRKETAAEAAKVFGVSLAFDNHRDLLSRPEVDLAVISVKVPFHMELASAALKARKAVYCEWPLGNGLAEAEQLAAMAREYGVVARVGLQARSAPVVKYVRQLVAEGYVGEVLSSSIVASGVSFGPTVAAHAAYLLDRKNGASMLTIPFGHTVDAFCWCLGEFTALNATFATRRPQVQRVGDGALIESNIADQVSVSGTLQNGAVASIHFRGGTSRGTNFLWEINGTEGDLLVEGDGGMIQMMPLRLNGARGDEKKVVDMAVPASCRWVPPETPEGFPFNLAQAYVRVGEDMLNGTRTAPTFDDAVVRHRMIEAIVMAAKTGRQQSYDCSKPA
jgi:predicted dehydrogenase